MARRIPFIQQLSATECGAACLAMTLAFHGRWVSVDEIRDTTGVDRDGTTLLGILEAARLYGLRGQGLSLDLEQLELLDAGAILHWEFNHFVVFERARKGGIDIVDPALGRRHVPLADVRRAFTGVALSLEPAAGFVRARPRPVLWRYLGEILGQSRLLTRVVVTSLLVQAFALAVPVMTGALVDQVVPRADAHLLLILSLGLAVVVAFHFVAALVRGHLLVHLRTTLDARMTHGFLDHLLDLPYDFFLGRTTGDLMMRLNSNTTIREILTAGALSGVLDGLLAVLYLAILFFASPTLGALVVGLALLHALPLLATRRRQRDLAARGLAAQAKAEGYQVEMLAAIETLKSAGAEQRANERFSALFVDALNASTARGALDATVDAVAGSLRLASPLLVLGYGASLVLDGALGLGAMLALAAVATGFLTPLDNLVATAGRMQLLGGYLERLEDVLGASAEQDLTKVKRAPALKGAISVEGLAFAYGPRAPQVVKDISVDIPAGKLVAIVGKSGSGKSTLARLLVGLYRPAAGRVAYDGVELADLELRSLRRQIGVVPQTASLFSGSLRANIALADPALPLDDVVAAAKTAQIHEDIAAMPMGYDTVVSSGGASLSGGQRQRVALARALVHRPVILLLDEATAALDAVAERAVQQALAALDCTRIVIAHRLSTVAGADLILVMDGGALVERGTHAELLARPDGIYLALIKAQIA